MIMQTNMSTKQLLRYLLLGITVLGTVACAGVFEEVSDLPLSRCIQPVNLNAIVNKAVGNEVRFVWDVTTDVKEYNLVVFKYEEDASAEETVYLDVTIDPSEVPYVATLEPNIKYSFKVQGLREGRDPSNWAVYSGSFRTEAVGKPLFLTLDAKTDVSVSFSWDKTIADYKKVDRIEYTVVNGPASATDGEYSLTEADIESATATITGLTPSTQYDFVLYYSVANRGYLNVWTNPSKGSAIEVSTKEDLVTLMTEGTDVYVKLSGSPYEIGTIEIKKGFRLIGEADADGNRPVLNGSFSILGTQTDQEYSFENVCFDGGGTRSHVMQKDDTGDQSLSFSFKNCEMHNYVGGALIYGNKDGSLVVKDFIVEGCDIHNMGMANAAVEIRKGGSLGTVSFVDNTIYDAFGNFMRIDLGVALGDVVMKNNTMKNVAPSPSNKSFFYVRGDGEWNNLTLTDNLFLLQGASASLFYSSTSTEAKNIPSAPMVSAKNNWMWETNEEFGGTTYDAKLTASEVDPCYNSKGNYFNLAISEAGNVGASKWWRAYVEKPEDLTMEVVTAPHVWNFSDATLFAGTAKRSMVRDNLLIAASDASPVKCDGALEFTKAVTLSKKGIPSDSYMAFKIDKPGSVYIELISPSGAGVTMATQVEGALNITPVGAAFSSETVQKILVPSVSAETMLYIYPSGPVKVSALEWSSDVAGANRALSTPVPAIDVTSLTEGDETAVSVSWEPIVNADTYEVVFNGKTVSQTETSFIIEAETVAALSSGVYTVSVKAKPTASDIYNTESAAGVVAFAVQPKAQEGGGEEMKEVTLTWDFSSPEWQDALTTQASAACAETNSNSNVTDWTVTLDGLTYTAGSGNGRWSTGGWIMPNGSGSSSKRVFSFTAPEDGTLKVWTTNTGDAADMTRTIAVVSGGETTSLAGGFGIAEGAQAVEFSVKAGSVLIYPDVKGLRFYKIEFTYTTSAPAAIEYDWNFGSPEWQDALTTQASAACAETNSNSNVTDWTVTLDGLTYTAGSGNGRWSTGGWIMPNGSGSSSKRVFSFTAPEDGTLKVWTTNTGDAADMTRTIAVVSGGETTSLAGGFGIAEGAQAVEFSVKAGSVLIYPDVKGLRFYHIYYINQ